ncbi:MAG: replication protein [Minisyncoccia bacterium]
MDTSPSFAGFKRSYKKGGFFMYPTEMEKCWHLLSGSEQKLLDFILRRTYGFQKLEDRISLSQFVGGVGKLGKGTGVSKAQAQRSLKTLEEKGFIRTERQGYQTRLIKLVLREEDAEPVKEKIAASDQVMYLISLFRDVVPTRVDRFMTEPKQIEATERLLKEYGSEKVEQYIAAAKGVLGKLYAPTIDSPVQLEAKLVQLIAYYQRERGKEQNEFRITID